MATELANKANGIANGFASSAQAKKMEAMKRQRHSRTPSADIHDNLSLAGLIRKGIVSHQLGLSLNLFLLAALSWLFFPGLRTKLQVFWTLSYPVVSSLSTGEHRRSPETTLYGQGPCDLSLVMAFIVLFTGVRAFMMDYVLMPFASTCGVKGNKGKIRFAEQAYLLLYYVVYWTWGVVLFVRDTPAAMSGLEPADSLKTGIDLVLMSMWTQFPLLLVDASMKLYYLSQMAFWVQQILVIHLEERRKDHFQMLTHHFVTVALMLGSYGYRQLRVGNAVLCVMDVVDLVLPLAKILRYMGWQMACDAAFALFVVLWLVARHICYLAICWSIYAHVHEVVMPYGLYSISTSAMKEGTNIGLRLSDDGGSAIWDNLLQPLLHPSAETVGFNPQIRWAFLTLLLALQCITIMWFIMICRVVARVLRGEGADDSRSDDEEEGEADEDEGEASRPTTTKLPPPQPSEPLSPSDEKPQKYIEVESTSIDPSFSTWRPASVSRTASNGSAASNSSVVASGSSTKQRKSKGLSTGLNLGEHKEILNRIGCLSDQQLAREREKRSPETSRQGQGQGQGQGASSGSASGFASSVAMAGSR